MNCLLVFAHPEHQSFNGAMKDLAVKALPAAGHKIRVSDLYGMGWNPVSDRANFTTVKNEDYYKQQDEELYAFENDGFAEDIQEELDKLAWCDMLIFQFPLWWFGLPAILKGWCDRVLAMGPAYGQGRMYDKGVFAGKRALLSLTTGGDPAGVGDIDQILYPINHGILYFVGFQPLQPFIAYQPAHLTAEQRTAELERYRAYLTNLNTAPLINYKSKVLT